MIDHSHRKAATPPAGQKERIAVALSGGVDSAMAAALLIEGGHEVLGLTMHLWQEPPEAGTDTAHGCYASDVTLPASVHNAQRVADALGIPMHVFDARRPFKQLVVDVLLADYGRGRTPNPCLYCNRHIKFGLLLHTALELGAQRMATGHYARASLAPNGHAWQLLKGADTKKDQSYVLCMLGQYELSRVRFPLGDMTKSQVRSMARARQLPAAHAEESQDLCFVPDNDYRRFVRRYAPQAFVPGPILDSQGREIGLHRGLASYTVGQRRGIGIAAPEALYVLRLDVERNALVVGPRRELGAKSLIAEDVHWVSGRAPGTPISITVKIRYKARLARATVTPLPGACAAVHLSEALRDITPGQGVVFYDGNVVLGGGLIAR